MATTDCEHPLLTKKIDFSLFTDTSLQLKERVFWMFESSIICPHRNVQSPSTVYLRERSISVYLMVQRSTKMRQRLRKGHSSSMHISHLRIKVGVI